MMRRMAGHVVGRFCIRRDYVILLGSHIEIMESFLEFREYPVREGFFT
jgi:hypothetical protein